MTAIEQIMELLDDPSLLDELTPVRVCDDAVNPDLVNTLRDEIMSRGFKFGWNSNSDVEFGHWNMVFAGKSKHNREPVEHELTGVARDVALAIKETALPPNAQIIRCYCNGYSFGTEGYPHTDSKIESDLTCILYINKHWRPEWAGETVFFDADDEIETAVLPKFNRLVVFPSAMLHAARSVSRICSDLRMVFVLKVRTE